MKLLLRGGGGGNEVPVMDTDYYENEKLKDDDSYESEAREKDESVVGSEGG